MPLDDSGTGLYIWVAKQTLMKFLVIKFEIKNIQNDFISKCTRKIVQHSLSEIKQNKKCVCLQSTGGLAVDNNIFSV